MNLFGSKRKKPAAKPQGGGGGAKDAMKKLKEKSEDLEKRQAHLQKQVDAHTAKAKQYAKAKNKKGSWSFCRASPLPFLQRPLFLFSCSAGVRKKEVDRKKHRRSVQVSKKYRNTTAHFGKNDIRR